MFMLTISQYIVTLTEVLNRLPMEPIERFVQMLAEARNRGQTVFVFGNGGSASTASHFVCDLVKNTVSEDLPRFRAVALNDNVPTFSAYANDVGYDSVFAEPLEVLARPEDLAVAISCSGNSPNVLRAVEVATRMQLHTVGLTGFSGGVLGDLVELGIIVPCDDMRRIEDVHLAICHAVHQALL
jgi:D-sedoheptulose 7-phosphate isomerase